MATLSSITREQSAEAFIDRKYSSLRFPSSIGVHTWKVRSINSRYMVLRTGQKVFLPHTDIVLVLDKENRVKEYMSTSSHTDATPQASGTAISRFIATISRICRHPDEHTEPLPYPTKGEYAVIWFTRESAACALILHGRRMDMCHLFSEGETMLIENVIVLGLSEQYNNRAVLELGHDSIVFCIPNSDETTSRLYGNINGEGSQASTDPMSAENHAEKVRKV